METVLAFVLHAAALVVSDCAQVETIVLNAKFRNSKVILRGEPETRLSFKVVGRTAVTRLPRGADYGFWLGNSEYMDSNELGLLCNELSHYAVRGIDLNIYSKLNGADLRKLSQLTELESFSAALGMRDPTDEAITDADLGLFSSFDHLEELSLRFFTGWNDHGITSLVGALPNLRRLDLSYCQLTPVGFQSLTKLHGLERLALRGAMFDPGHEDVLAGLTRFPELESLDIGDNMHLNDESVRLLIQTLPCLREIGLRGVLEIQPDTFSILAQMPRLESIDLSNTREFTDECLARLAMSRTLRAINLDECDELTDAGVRSFVRRCSELQSVRMHGLSSEDPEFILKLRELRPDCHFEL